MGIEMLVLGLISLLVGVASTATQNKRNRDWQEQMYEKQLSDQREDRDTEYKMESPVALAQQYKSAGLNPLGINAGGASVNHVASSMPTPSSQFYDPTSAIEGAASMAFQSKQMKLQETQSQLLNEKTRAETFNIWQDGMSKQIENGFKPELLQETINQIKADIDKNKIDKQLGEMQLNFLEDALNKGINPVEDTHNKTLAEIDSILSNTENQKQLTNSQLNTAKMQRGLIALQQKHQSLSNQQYEQEVKEFLDTSYARKFFVESQVFLTDIANSAAQRANLLDSFTNETERILAKQILELAKDGGTSFDAVFTRWLTSNPTALVNVIGQFASFIPALNYTKVLK